ncbi:MAG: mannosyltransferase [Myxococcota bacterium]
MALRYVFNANESRAEGGQHEAASAVQDKAQSTQSAQTSESTADSEATSFEWVAFALVLAAATAVRFYGLTAGGLHLDEGYSLIQSERSLYDIFALNRFDANPPLYIVILHLWRAVLGDGEFALKSLAALGGVVGVLAAGLAARERFGRTAGVATSLIVALNAFHIHHSQEIRGYSLLFAAIAAADYLFVRWHRRGEGRALVGWAITAWVAVNIHHFAWYFVALHTASVVFFSSQKDRRASVLKALACVVFASAPMLTSFAVHLVVHQSQSWIPLRDFNNLVIILGAVGGELPVAVLVWGAAVLGLGAFGLKLATAKASPPTSEPHDLALCFGVPALQLLLPVILFAGSHLFFPMLLSRYCLITLLPLSVLAGAGVASIKSNPALAAIALAFVVVSYGPLQSLYAKELRHAYLQQWSEAVADGYREGDVVVYTDKHVFVPSIALHPPEMDEFMLPELKGRHRSSVLEHYTAREVRRPPLVMGDYRRLWLVKHPRENLRDILLDPWFAGVGLRLIRRVPRSEVYLFALGRRDN